MDPTDFRAPAFGRAARRPGDRWALWYFEPSSIPRELTLYSATVLALSEADAALGHLQGLGHVISDPQLLIGPYVTREALASLRIEGTRASLAEVLQAGAEVDEAGHGSDDVAEVQSYVRATYRGLELIKTLPISPRCPSPTILSRRATARHRRRSTRHDRRDGRVLPKGEGRSCTIVAGSRTMCEWRR